MRGWETVMYDPLNGCILFIFERQFSLSSLLMICAFRALFFFCISEILCAHLNNKSPCLICSVRANGKLHSY